MNLPESGYFSESKAEFNHWLVQLVSKRDIGEVGPPDRQENCEKEFIGSSRRCRVNVAENRVKKCKVEYTAHKTI